LTKSVCIHLTYVGRKPTDRITKAPDVGVGEEVAHFYFLQLLSGLVTSNESPVARSTMIADLSAEPPRRLTFMQRAYATGILNLKIFFLMPPERSRYQTSGFAQCTNLKSRAEHECSPKDAEAYPTLRQRYVSVIHFQLPSPDRTVQLNLDKPYAAEPIDAWGIGVILFTMVVGSAYDLSPPRSDISFECEDTPWDEPTTRSYEYSRYVSGAFIDDAPWDRIPALLFCSSFLLLWRFLYYTNVTLGSVDNRLTHHQSAGSHDTRGCVSTPLGAHVCPAMLP
jgi:serine/threonine-protein kinase CHEK1